MTSPRTASGVTVLLAETPDGTGTDGRRTTRALLLRGAAALLGVAESQLGVAHRPGGRPMLTGAGRGLHISVSHGRGVVAVALTALARVGVDVERVRPLPATRLARRWLGEEESRWVAQQLPTGRSAAFLRLWVQKEAVGKALGTGLRDGGTYRTVLPPEAWFGTHLVPLTGEPRTGVCVPRTSPDLCLGVATWGGDVAGAPVTVRTPVPRHHPNPPDPLDPLDPRDPEHL
jgi:4'-phosphopantetheinyl transferase